MDALREKYIILQMSIEFVINKWIYLKILYLKRFIYFIYMSEIINEPTNKQESGEKVEESFWGMVSITI
jgi:hypothetical protein